MSIDWKKIWEERVLPLSSEDDRALARVYAILRWLEKHPAPEGNDPLTGKPWVELHVQFQQFHLDEIERYRWEKVGFEPTQEMLDACRDLSKEESLLRSRLFALDHLRYRTDEQ